MIHAALELRVLEPERLHVAHGPGRHVRTTVSFGRVDAAPPGRRRGRWPAGRVDQALQPSVDGRRGASYWVIGNQRRQVLQVPLEGIFDDEDEPAVRVLRLGIGLVDGDHEPPSER